MAVQQHQSIRAALDEEVKPLILRRMQSILLLSIVAIALSIGIDAALGRWHPFLFPLQLVGMIAYGLGAFVLRQYGAARGWSWVRAAVVVCAAMMLVETSSIDIATGGARCSSIR